MLSQAQRDHYQEQGFLILENLCDQQQIDSILSETSTVISEAAYGVDENSVCWDSQIRSGKVELDEDSRELGVFKLHHPHELFPFFEELGKQYPGLEAVCDLLGEDVDMIAQQVIMKPPFHGQWQPYHQDGHYFGFKPSAGCGVWIALDEARVENGCLWVVPGSHKFDLLEHEKPDVEDINRAFLEAQGFDKDAGIPVELKPGSAVIFHNKLLHMSGPNASPHSRRCVVAHFANAHWEFKEGYKRLPVSRARQIA